MPTILRKLSDLAICQAIAFLPQRADDHPEFLALVESIREHGVLNPFIINEKDEIMDARHRRRACRILGIKEVSCEVRDSSEAVSLALTSIMARRHYSKGALAYMALPLLKQAAEEGIARRIANMPKMTKKGLNAEKQNSAFPGDTPLSASEEVAEKLGISRYYVQSVTRLEKTFVAADALIGKWLEGNPESAEKWQAWDKSTPAPWASFRADYCRENGHDENETKTAVFIPESFREEYVGKLYDNELSIEAIHKAIGGALATKGALRNDKNPECDQFAVVIKRKLLNFADNVWGQWHELDTDSQAHLALDFAATAKAWPLEVQLNTFNQLKALHGKGVAK